MNSSLHTSHRGFCLESNGIGDLPNPVRFSIDRILLRVTDHLGLCDISPINKWLDGVCNGRLVEVLCVKGGDRADVAVVDLIKAAGLDDGHGHRGILRQSFSDGQASGPSANNLPGQ